MLLFKEMVQIHNSASKIEPTAVTEIQFKNTEKRNHLPLFFKPVTEVSTNLKQKFPKLILFD